MAPNLSLNRTIYAPHTPRPLRCNERVIDHYDLHLVQDIGSGRALMAEYFGPSNAEPGDNRRISGTSEARPRETVRRASDGCRTTVGHVRVDHGRADILVTEQLLDGSDVVAVLEQMSRETVRTYDSLP